MAKAWLSGLVMLAALLVVAACSQPEPSDTGVITSPRLKEDGEQAGVAAEAAPPEGTEDVLPDYDIITLLPRDAIPAIFNPEFLSAEEANAQYAPDELVLGVEIDGDTRAYSIPHLSGHEIVNDMVGGRPIAITW